MFPFSSPAEPGEPHSHITAPLIPKTPTENRHDHPQRLNQEQSQSPRKTPAQEDHCHGRQHHRDENPEQNQNLRSYRERENSNKTHLSVAITEAGRIANIALPMVLTGLLLFSRSLISMLFLGRLGNLPLAGGSLAIGFANITGYSILSGLAMGMEPICGQAFGAKKFKLLGVTLQRTVFLLLLTSIPIGFLWLNMQRILLFCGQDSDIAAEAQSYILFSLPDLLVQSFLHPLRIYLRTQSITMPLTYCAILAIFLHFPINYLLVSVLNLGTKGVALSGVWTNFNLVLSLLLYILLSGVYRKTWCGTIPLQSLKRCKSLVNLAVPTCVSVCLEWWWYEIMILLCGLLVNPTATVASMGILIQTTSLIYIFPSSLSFSVSTRVGNELGANRPARAKLAAIVGLSFSFALGIAALFFALTVRKTWATMFTTDADILALTATVLPIIGLCELGNCPQTTGCGALRGTARPKMGANINLWCFYLVGMPVATWLGFFAGYDFKGLWLGLLAAQASCAVAMLVVLCRTDWEEQSQRAKDLTESVLGIEDDDKEETNHSSESSLDDDEKLGQSNV
ncbi:protein DETOXIFICATION 49-like [Malania oleifera]|uniref:protein DETOXIFICATION 49-like n=1 Tax=Malania oleifera TaxID=397392 RepID=UPI0025AE5D65|nr:protein DETOXIFICATION 49-like [Malania oleifera]